MSPRSDAGPRAGFTLVEVLVALVVAGLLLTAFARVFAGAWRAARTPIDVVSGVAVARAVLHAGNNRGALKKAEAEGYSFERRVGSLRISDRPSRLAPAPGDVHGAAPAKEDEPLQVQPNVVDVTTPSGRSMTFERVELQPQAK